MLLFVTNVNCFKLLNETNLCLVSIQCVMLILEHYQSDTSRQRARKGLCLNVECALLFEKYLF